MKIKILHIQLFPILSGVQNVTLNEFRYLISRGEDIYLICKEPGPLSIETEKLGGTVFYCRDLVREVSFFKDFRALFRLCFILKRLRPDVVHTHSSKTGILGRVASKLVGIRTIIHTVHGYSFPMARTKLHFCLYLFLEFISSRLCDAVIVLNHDDYLRTTLKLKLPTRKVFLVPNGVDVHRFSSLESSTVVGIRNRYFGTSSTKVLVTMVGRLWPQKNPLLLLHAAALLLSVGIDDFIIAIVGDGELRNSCENFIELNNLTSHVHLMGWVDDVPEILASSDIFVLPSKWEGMPLAILEAMSTGLPILASDIPGNSDLVSNGVDGYLFKDGDKFGLAFYLSLLIADDGIRNYLGQNARRKVLNDYQLEIRNTRVLDIYKHFQRMY